MLAATKTSRYDLVLIYASYKDYCYRIGIEPLSYANWKSMADSSYKMAGVTNK